jgi:hypothetical protein
MQAVLDRIDELPKAALIALMVVGFMLFWPLGLAMLALFIWRGRMFCGKSFKGSWCSPEARSQWRERRDEFRAWRQRERHSRRHGSGNVAFDEYRDETLRRLEDEQREFHDYLDKLRAAKDRAEFDQFMNDRRNRPPAPPAEQPAT